MLALSGRVGDKTYKDELISAEELLRLFEVDHKEVFQDYAVFEMDDQYVKRDRFGVTKHPKGYSLPARLSGTFGGNSVVIQYFENEVVRNNGRTERMPKKVTDFRNRYMQLHPDNNKEKVAFYFLAPFCGTSPLYRKGKVKYYNYVNKEEKAIKSLAGERDIYDLYAMVFEETNLLKLRRKARGIKIQGQSVAGADKMSVKELQDALIKVAKANPTKFKAAYESADTDVRGIIAEAISYRVVETRRIGSDQKEIKFAEEYGGDRIAKIDMNAKPESVLYSMAMKDWATLGKRLEKEVNNFGIQMAAEDLKKRGNIKTPKLAEIQAIAEDIITAESINKMKGRELIDLGVKNDCFFFDELNKNVHFRKVDESVDAIPFLEKVEKKDLISSLLAKVKDKEENRLKMLLKKKYK